jgi:hypothetical protein
MIGLEPCRQGVEQNTTGKRLEMQSDVWSFDVIDLRVKAASKDGKYHERINGVEIHLSTCDFPASAPLNFSCQNSQP